MAQRQKHWVQAMLNESTYTPVGYAYDIVGWSSPLLFNVAGGSSGAVLSPKASVGRRAGRAGPAGAAGEAAVGRRSTRCRRSSSRGIESSGWLRWLLDRWGVDLPRRVGDRHRRPAASSGAEVLLVPDGYALKDPNVPSDPYGYKDLGPKGRENLKAWVQNGGRYVGWLDGGVLASALGISRHGLRRRRRRRRLDARAACSACASTTAARWRPASGRSRGRSTTRATC